jgi:multidrug efflux pump subunit AcrA (membrane-fusion protein)
MPVIYSSRRRFVILAVLLVLAGGFWLMKQQIVDASQPAPPAAPPPGIPVVAGTVASQDVPIYLRAVGTAIAYNNVVVRSQITGQLISINSTQGQAVHAGDLLAQIDPRPYPFGECGFSACQRVRTYGRVCSSRAFRAKSLGALQRFRRFD